MDDATRFSSNAELSEYERQRLKNIAEVQFELEDVYENMTQSAMDLAKSFCPDGRGKKRPRGRPRKSQKLGQVESQVEAATSSSSANRSTKRPRGRPRKCQPLGQVESQVESQVMSQAETVQQTCRRSKRLRSLRHPSGISYP